MCVCVPCEYYIRIYIYIFLIYILYVYVYLCIFMYMYMYLYMCMYMYLYMYMYMYMYMYICMCIHIYIYVHTYPATILPLLMNKNTVPIIRSAPLVCECTCAREESYKTTFYSRTTLQTVQIALKNGDGFPKKPKYMYPKHPQTT